VSDTESMNLESTTRIYLLFLVFFLVIAFHLLFHLFLDNLDSPSFDLDG